MLVQQFQQQPFATIYVLNGPGSFTNLRLGCLVINTLQNLTSENITILSINKPEFRNTCYQHHAIPHRGVLYIGQKKNAWLFDTVTQSHEKKTLEELAQFPDMFREDANLWQTEHKATMHVTTTDCHLTFDNQTTTIALTDFPWTQVQTLTPHYLIQPNISEPKKK
jgi:tRNA A37 threonylcarbamoyladenosine modification protein TsaB